jgi:PIN domain nuclease of toxin-antitoxin system
LVSAITAWEVGVLVSRGRLSMSVDPLSWFRLLTARVDVATLSPEILIASSSLPHCDLRDPADRIIAATARLLGYRIITRDARILAYAAAGHLRAITC